MWVNGSIEKEGLHHVIWASFMQNLYKGCLVRWWHTTTTSSMWASSYRKLTSIKSCIQQKSEEYESLIASCLHSGFDREKLKIRAPFVHSFCKVNTHVCRGLKSVAKVLWFEGDRGYKEIFPHGSLIVSFHRSVMSIATYVWNQKLQYTWLIGYGRGALRSSALKGIKYGAAAVWNQKPCVWATSKLFD